VSRPIKAVFASHGGTVSGGAERTLLEVVLALAADGRVEPLVTVPATGPLAVALREGGIRVMVVPTPMWTPYRQRFFSAPTLVGRLRRRTRVTGRTVRYSGAWLRVLLAERPDVVVTNTVTAASPALAAKVLGIPHVWMIHEFLTLDHGLEYALGEPLSQRAIGALSARVVVNSQAVAMHFSPRVHRRKLIVAYPPVNSRPVALNDVESKQLRLLLLGRQTRSKGSALAIQALGLLRHSAKPPVLRLTGWITDEFRAELEALAQELGVADRVEICGGTEDPFAAIEWANVVLMCSAHEAFGRVTAEALKCGRPVIGSRSGGTLEIVREGVDGLLFDPGDAQQLAAAVDRLAKDRKLLRNLSDRALERNADRFTKEKYMGIVAGALLSVAGVG
jgi:glycosyltransferase involved in cell wall biosynthesis